MKTNLIDRAICEILICMMYVIMFIPCVVVLTGGFLWKQIRRFK